MTAKAIPLASVRLLTITQTSAPSMLTVHKARGLMAMSGAERVAFRAAWPCTLLPFLRTSWWQRVRPSDGVAPAGHGHSAGCGGSEERQEFRGRDRHLALQLRMHVHNDGVGQGHDLHVKQLQKLRGAVRPLRTNNLMKLLPFVHSKAGSGKHEYTRT
jgi:hypothetical protein